MDTGYFDVLKRQVLHTVSMSESDANVATGRLLIELEKDFGVKPKVRADYCAKQLRMCGIDERHLQPLADLFETILTFR